MSVYIRGMEMPQTGLYLVSVDNTDGRDKTIATAMKANDKKGMNIIGSYELIPVPDHGRLIDADALIKKVAENMEAAKKADNYDWWNACSVVGDFVMDAPTIIPANKGGGK